MTIQHSSSNLSNGVTMLTMMNAMVWTLFAIGCFHFNHCFSIISKSKCGITVYHPTYHEYPTFYKSLPIANPAMKIQNLILSEWDMSPLIIYGEHLEAVLKHPSLRSLDLGISTSFQSLGCLANASCAT